MSEYVELLKDSLQERRDITRNVYSIASTLCRATKNKRISWEQGIKILENVKIKEEK